MSNQFYDRLKMAALIFVPCCAFFSTILSIWNVPYTEQITATLVAIDTLLGALVQIASNNYNKKKEEELAEAKRINGQDSEENNAL